MFHFAACLAAGAADIFTKRVRDRERMRKGGREGREKTRERKIALWVRTGR